MPEYGHSERIPDVPVVLYDSYLLDRAEHVLEHLPLIRTAIPEKSTLTEEEVRRTLASANGWWGCVVARHWDTVETMGIVVWYEAEKSLYLWLGAIAPEYRRRGLCSFILHYLYESIDKYDRWFTKVGRDNGAARTLLENFGFKTYDEEANGEVVLMEWRYPQEIHWWQR